MTHNTQKGLQPPKLVIREIDVTDESIGHFMRWLLDDKGVTSTDLVNVVEQPHHWQKLWEEYHEQDG